MQWQFMYIFAKKESAANFTLKNDFMSILAWKLEIIIYCKNPKTAPEEPHAENPLSESDFKAQGQGWYKFSFLSKKM